jgi:thiol-disulfide isomerase/thioredoxin
LRADEPSADTLWKKSDDAINALEKKPNPPPASREAMIEHYKKVVTDADAANKEFLAKFPNDPRRWKIRMFDAKTASLRKGVGLESHGDLKTILAEVLAAPDADAKTKGQASAITLLVSASKDLKAGGDTDAWVKQAEEHLKKYPDEELNEPLKEKLGSVKSLADLKTKPLDLKFKAVDGREVDLAQMRGKVVLVDFWATWCGPCVGEVPNVVKTYEKLHPRGFEIVGISLDSDKEKLESFTKDKQMTWPQYFDGKGWQNEISSKFGISSIPAMWLIDKKGMLVSTNARDGLEEQVEKQLAE